MCKNKVLIILLFVFSVYFNNGLIAANGYILQGKVYNKTTNDIVDFATIIILEEKSKKYTNSDGSYRLNFPSKGEYTIIVSSPGLQNITFKLNITKNITKDIFLKPFEFQGAKIIIKEQRDIQNISRRTMDKSQIKATPAAINDSVVALTSLPGVERENAFDGPLVIRGMEPRCNYYFIDDIPLFNPLHFGDMHSIVNTNLINRIDLYSSSFPVNYGGALSAIIDISTIDDVDKTEVISDVNILQASALIKIPWKRNISGLNEADNNKENCGYLMVSARYGYLSLILPKILKNDDEYNFPDYYDYQIKNKYYFNDKNSLTFLLIGAKDSFHDKEMDKPEEGEDYLLSNTVYNENERVYNTGLYYEYQTNDFSNRLIGFAALRRYSYSNNSLRDDVAEWLKKNDQNCDTNIYGFKDKVRLNWFNSNAILKMSLEYTFFDFKVNGYEYFENQLSTQGYDPANPDIYIGEKVEFDDQNTVWGGYIENEFKYSGFKLIPGIRSDYLVRTEEMTVDPRAMISYEFESGTIISMAGGKYSSFLQTNPHAFSYLPALASCDYIKPEKAIHSIIGIEQSIDMFTIGIEGYYNRFYDIFMTYPHYENGTLIYGQNSGKAKVYGFELILRKDLLKGQSGVFGWMGYTFNKVREKSGITGNVYNSDGTQTTELYDENGNNWKTGTYEKSHSLKLVAGYTYKRHTLSGKFQYHTSYPYTPIINSQESPKNSGRYVPIYSTKSDKHFPAKHRLDLRYTYKLNRSWGYASFYFEVLNVYAFAPVTGEKWRYDRPYQKNKNPVFEKSEDIDSGIIPNFGIEIKF